MVNLSSNLLILFGLSSLLAFVFPLLKDGVFKQLSFKPLLSSLVPFCSVLLPFCGLFALAGAFGIAINETLPYFAIAALLSFTLAKIGLPPQLRGVLLLVAAYLLTANISAGNDMSLALPATLLGLLVTKIADHLLLDGQRSLDDILPPMIWLTGTMWHDTTDKGGANMHTSILLGIICVVQVLRIMQRPFTSDDKVFIKRVVLATSGGLGALLVINKLVLKPEDAPMALLFGAGLFVTYLFQNIDKEGLNKVSGTTVVMLLIAIAMLTMAATRFYGIFGLILLAPAAMVAPWFGITQFIGLFFCVRALLELFVTTYNSNVTGINIEHSYVGASLYAGFIVVACLTMLLRDIKDRRLLAALFLAAGVLLPMAANYYLHAEPTASMLVAVSVAAIIFAVLGPVFIQDEQLGYENLLLLPALMTVVGVTYGGLIEAGNEATNAFRTQVLLYILGAIIACLIISLLIKKFMGGKPRALAASNE